MDRWARLLRPQKRARFAPQEKRTFFDTVPQEMSAHIARWVLRRANPWASHSLFCELAEHSQKALEHGSMGRFALNHVEIIYPKGACTCLLDLGGASKVERLDVEETYFDILQNNIHENRLLRIV